MRLQWRDGMQAQAHPAAPPLGPTSSAPRARGIARRGGRAARGVAQAADRRAGDQSRRRDHRLRSPGRRGQRPGHAQPHPGDRDHRDRPVHQRQGRGRRGRDRRGLRGRPDRARPPADPGHGPGLRHGPLRRAGDRAWRPAVGRGRATGRRGAGSRGAVPASAAAGKPDSEPRRPRRIHPGLAANPAVGQPVPASDGPPRAAAAEVGRGQLEQQGHEPLLVDQGRRLGRGRARWPRAGPSRASRRAGGRP